MISRYTGWYSSLLLVFAGFVCSPALASVRVSVLAVPEAKIEQKPSHEISELLRQVLRSFDGVELSDLSTMDSGLRARVEKIVRRCGSQTDCQERIARLMRVQVLVLVRAQAIAGGVLVNLAVRDMGTGNDLCKVSRTMTGSSGHKKEVLETIVTSALFPERMIGRVELKLEPLGGDVYLDGQLKVTSAPGAVNLEAIRSGHHTLLVKHEGYRDFIAIIQVPFKGVSQINVTMRQDSTRNK